MIEGLLGEHWGWKSWVDSANEPSCDFPLQNLPFCVFETPAGRPHIGVGLGDFILDLHDCSDAGLLDQVDTKICQACKAPVLNPLMESGRQSTSLLRRTLMLLLKEGLAAPRRSSVQGLLHERSGAVFRKPVQVGDYTDFYASIQHATNVGQLFRPDQPLFLNYKYLPIGYHGRASSLVISGSPVVRPHGQIKAPSAGSPIFGPSQQLDYELEVGAYIGVGNPQGESIPINSADAHLFGLSLVNDWSARDIQAWEYQPLGPFLGKSFATSLSPWVVAMDALAPFRVPLAPRPPGDPELLPYLSGSTSLRAAFDLKLEAYLSTPMMRDRVQPPIRLSSSSLRDLYWSFEQMTAHHSSNGCNLMPGDLLASGTVSASGAGAQGSLLEITQRGSVPIHLPNGETRSFLKDGDEVILRGFCEQPGLPRVGLGECRGIIARAIEQRRS